MTTSDVPISAQRASELLDAARNQIGRVLVGQRSLVDGMLVALLARGHCLLEGVPGVAKTLAVRTFATVVGGSFARVQFTPDLVPSDIVGTRIFRAGQERFDVELGPIFVNFLLADEINRAPAKVQSAMLEVMAERQVTIGGTTHPVPNPFMVIATQNPVESEGVYPLPEAQRDRFLLRLIVPLPSHAEEQAILDRMSTSTPSPDAVLTPTDVLALQRYSQQLYCHPLVADYVVRLVMATRQPTQFAAAALEGYLEVGVSPRATLGLMAAARAHAVLNGREFVLPYDVQMMAPAVLEHRLLLAFDPMREQRSAHDIVQGLLQLVPAPVEVPTGNAPGPAPGAGGAMALL